MLLSSFLLLSFFVTVVDRNETKSKLSKKKINE